MEYSKFLEAKQQSGGMYGFKSLWLPDFLFDYQKYLIDWALLKGKSATFADTGMGKTPMQLVTAENIVRHTNKNVLIITPLSVSHQTVEEGERFGIEVNRSRDGKPKGKITVTNYQQLEKFDSNDFIACLCDESSILKNAKGRIKTDVTRFMNKMPYRGLYSATPSPNDFVELGSSSEALGELNYMDMVSQFFRDTSNDKNPQWSTPKYELKGHAVDNFWRWVSSWARACRKPSDLGDFDDSTHILPELIEREHILQVTKPLPGELFVRIARTLTDQRKEGKITIEQRCEKANELVKNHDSSILWVDYNYEGDMLSKIVSDSVEVSGKDSDDEKEDKFISFEKGQIKRLIIKPSIGALGMNWQHCGHQTFFPNHSYERYYQGVRRSWRYGRKDKVHIDIIGTEGGVAVLKNIRRKNEDATRMFSKMVEHMKNELKIKPKIHTNNNITLPNWI